MDTTSQVVSCYQVSGTQATKAICYVLHPVKSLTNLYVIRECAREIRFVRWSLLMAATLLASCNTGVAQSLNGVYLTKPDFLRNRLTNASNEKGDWLQVDFNDDVVISRNGSVTRFKHHEVYGYFAEGHKHVAWGSRRKLFSNAGYYKLMDTSGLIVLQTRVQKHKFSHDLYVYCRSIDGPKKLLTLRNLSKDFRYHQSFIETLRSIEKPHRLHRMVDGTTLLNRVYLELVQPVEDSWPKRIVKSEKLRSKKPTSVASGRSIALASNYYHWYGTK